MLTHPPPLTVRSSDLTYSGRSSRDLRRAAERGTMERVVRGAYVDSTVWRDLGVRARYVARIHATVERLTGRVAVSHWSAAAIWGLPVPDAWPDDVQVIDTRRATSSSRAGIHRRPGTLVTKDIVEWEGIAVTSPSRTAADICLSTPFDEAVMVVDFGLHFGMFTKEQVRDHIVLRPRARRHTTALAAVQFASERAEWPGESFSRVGIADQGFPAPLLQEPFYDREGKIGVVDFFWPDARTVGEFDGDWKYTYPRFMAGRTVAQVVRDEKRRNERLEAHPGIDRVVRWRYAVARNPRELARRLIAGGVRRENPRVRQALQAAARR